MSASFVGSGNILITGISSTGLFFMFAFGFIVVRRRKDGLSGHSRSKIGGWSLMGCVGLKIGETITDGR